MTDQITDTLRTSMSQIVDMAPDAPGLPPVHRPVRDRPVVALASGFAAVIVTVGVVVAALTLPDTAPVGSGGTDPSPRDAAFAELDAAALAATECVEDLGLVTQPPVYQADIFVFEFTWASGTEEQEAAAESCLATVYEPVNAVWMDTYGPDPTPPLDYAAIAAGFGAEPIADAEIERVTGGGGFVPGSGYRLNQVLLDEAGAELGLIMYQERLGQDGTVYSCIGDYAIIDAANLSGIAIVSGSANCAPTLGAFAGIVEFGMALSQSCGPMPKEDPRFDGEWMLLSIWGIPGGASVVDVELGDGSVVAVEISGTGVAQELWENADSIVSIDFQGMNGFRLERVSGHLPASEMDCAADDGPG